ncbi:hypothetical protein KC845_04030 [Candidatus Kaiserbacteria bacterium]|nr:hypothetical protein [Candidatus Kaiserbacteria bacterium]
MDCQTNDQFRLKAVIMEVFKDKNVFDEFDGALWRKVFVKYFGSPPDGDDDERWDALLHKTGLCGLKVCHEFLHKDQESEQNEQNLVA